MKDISFLIIGAMKAGTTTVYRDLSQHPNIFMPQQKEPETLVRLGPCCSSIRADYQSLFRHATKHHILGEASTAYAKKPTFNGVARTARLCLGPHLKIIYVRRDPVSRLVSHYVHELARGRISVGLEVALDKHPELIAYSRYEWQLEDWRENFGDSNILNVNFEEYVNLRVASLENVFQFLGVEGADFIDGFNLAQHNAADGKYVIKNKITRNIVGSAVYQRTFKRHVPRTVRDALRGLFARRSQGRNVLMSEQARLRLQEEFKL